MQYHRCAADGPAYDPFYGPPLKLGARDFSSGSAGSGGAAGGAPLAAAAARALRAISRSAADWDTMDALKPQKVGAPLGGGGGLCAAPP
jgi:hypothetical protein